jgi:hypothetical protein
MNGKVGIRKVDIHAVHLRQRNNLQLFEILGCNFNTSGYQPLFLEQRVSGVALSDCVASLVALPAFEGKWDHLVSSQRQESHFERPWSFPQLKKAYHLALRVMGMSLCLYIC